MDAMFKETAATPNVDAEEDAAGTVAEAADQERIGANFNAQEDVAAGAAEFADQGPSARVSTSRTCRMPPTTFPKLPTSPKLPTRTPGGTHVVTEDPQDAVATSEGAGQESGGANLEPKHLQNAAVPRLHFAYKGRGRATNCAWCGTAFERGEQRLIIDGLLYHGVMCADYAKRIAIATR